MEIKPFFTNGILIVENKNPQESNDDDEEFSSSLESSIIRRLPLYRVWRKSFVSDSTCDICYQDFKVGDYLRSLPCKHKFHFYCIENWLRGVGVFCPVDRKRLVLSEEVYHVPYYDVGAEDRETVNVYPDMSFMTRDIAPLFQAVKSNEVQSGKGTSSNTLQKFNQKALSTQNPLRLTLKTDQGRITTPKFIDSQVKECSEDKEVLKPSWGASLRDRNSSLEASKPKKVENGRQSRKDSWKNVDNNGTSISSTLTSNTSNINATLSAGPSSDIQKLTNIREKKKVSTSFAQHGMDKRNVLYNRTSSIPKSWNKISFSEFGKKSDSECVMWVYSGIRK